MAAASEPPRPTSLAERRITNVRRSPLVIAVAHRGARSARHDDRERLDPAHARRLAATPDQITWVLTSYIVPPPW